MLGSTRSRRCYILNIYDFRDFFKFLFPWESMGAIDLWGVASIDPSGLIGRIYVGDH